MLIQINFPRIGCSNTAGYPSFFVLFNLNIYLYSTGKREEEEEEGEGGGSNSWAKIGSQIHSYINLLDSFFSHLQPSGDLATIEWITVGGRTSAFVPELQRLVRSATQKRPGKGSTEESEVRASSLMIFIAKV